MPDAWCPEKPEIFDFIVFRGSAIPGTGNRDPMPDLFIIILNTPPCSHPFTYFPIFGNRYFIALLDLHGEGKAWLDCYFFYF
jgi:hypothetical protein